MTSQNVIPCSQPDVWIGFLVLRNAIIEKSLGGSHEREGRKNKTWNSEKSIFKRNQGTYILKEKHHHQQQEEKSDA